MAGNLRHKKRLDYRLMNEGTKLDQQERIKKREVLPDLYNVERIVSVKNCQKELIDNERLNSRFRDLSYKILSEVRSVKGGQRTNLLSKKNKVVTIFKSELVNVKQQLCILKELNVEKIELEKKYRELTEHISKENELGHIISEQNLDIHALQQKNAFLANHIKTLEDQLPKLKFESEIDMLTRRTRNRTLKRLETEAQKALWFAETFGLTPKALKLTSKNGKNFYLNFKDDEKSLNYDSMSDDDKEKIKKLVFLLDKFCISDAAYHELAMIHDEMPRSYLLIQCKNELNKMVEIERLPGNVPGAMINVNSEIEKLLERHVIKHKDFSDVKIKFSGDGAKVSRISNFVIFSLSNVSTNENTLSFQEQQTFAIVECSENYDCLKRCCKPVFDQFNNIISKKKWHICGQDLNVSYFVCADMKFLQLMLGLGGSTGEYACPWCKVDKQGRSDLSRPWDFYHTSDFCRKIDDMLDISIKKSYGCKHMPLISLPVDHFIPDELHLMLRVTDVLLRNLIDGAMEMDSDLKVKHGKPVHLKKLTELIQDCGVGFSVWQNRSGEMEWTSLSGSDKVKLLNHLPSKIAAQDGVLFEDSKIDIVNLWKDFHGLYKYINNTTDNGIVVFERTKAWLQAFLSIGRKNKKGYNPHNVTPYMHCLVYHVPYFSSNFGPLRNFSGQGVEKNNDVVKQIHQKKSNKWDTAVSALVVRKRLEYGLENNFEREKRPYEKHSAWWENDLKNCRSEKRRKIADEIAEADTKSENSVDFKIMTEQELRVFLKSHGINTKIRNREKLMNIISSLDKEFTCI